MATLFSSLDPLPTVLRSPDEVVHALASFTWKGQHTLIDECEGCEASDRIPVLTNEFWTSRQRAASSLHEISYRACFKPQLPEFFISRLTEPGDPVYDPFAGRGTTLLEAALLGRVPLGCDVNPLSRAMIWPRLAPPRVEEVVARLGQLDLSCTETPTDLLTFYHPDTLSQISALRSYLLERETAGTLDEVDAWIRMVALNRLTGHSPGFLSVYTLPPNQAVSVDSQRKINARRRQTPPYRDLRAIVSRKTRQLLADVDATVRETLAGGRAAARFEIGSCATAFWEPGSVQLIVTSPPFLDVVDYATDNWLRAWFCGLDVAAIPIERQARLEDWRAFVTRGLPAVRAAAAAGGLRRLRSRRGPRRPGAAGRRRDPMRRRRRARAGVRRDQSADVYQDREHLGRVEQRQRHEQQPDRGVSEGGLRRGRWGW